MADGPLKAFWNSRSVKDTVTDALVVDAQANSGADGLLTSALNLRVRVDLTTGHLLVTQK